MESSKSKCTLRAPESSPEPVQKQCFRLQCFNLLEILILSFSDINRPFQRQKYEIKVWKNQFVVNFHTPGSSLEKKIDNYFWGQLSIFFLKWPPDPPLGTGVLDLFIRKRKKRSYVLCYHNIIIEWRHIRKTNNWTFLWADSRTIRKRVHLCIWLWPWVEATKLQHPTTYVYSGVSGTLVP